MAKSSTYTPIAGQGTNISPTTTTVQSLALPGNTSAVLISSETNDARVTFDGSTPTSTTGHKIPKDLPPLLILVGTGATIKALSNAAGTAIVQITPLQ